MQVTKRNGLLEPVDLNKITNRIRKLAEYTNSNVIDPILVAQKVCSSLYDTVTTKELDDLSSEISIAMITVHPDYAKLSAYISISNLHKSTEGVFSSLTTNMLHHGLVSTEYAKFVETHKEQIENTICYENDYKFDFFGFKTLVNAYLFKIDGQLVERPQDMLMRVSLGIHLNDISSAMETYEYMSNKYFIHATPTLFNTGTNHQQLSSCFLIEMQDDSISGIYNTLHDCAQISKHAGGIGLHIHKLRATGSDIRNLKGVCTGIVPSLRVFNATSRYVNQGGKRPGSIAIYLSVDHPDILKFLELKKNHGDEEQRCRDLFYGLWLSDLFMKRVENNQTWSLFCPSKLDVNLQELVGEEYEREYERLERENKAVKTITAQDIWLAICNSQIETGVPYMLYKDSINKKSNQQNVGVIKSSNLCCEIVEYTSPDEVAVCNLASIALPQFVEKTNTFNFEELHKVTKIITRNLNKVIDVNFYPLDKAEKSNKRHRPIGIGVQGLADVYILMRYRFESSEAKALNKHIFETMYHAAVEQSMELSKELGPYETFEGSPISNGQFQFDLWNVDPISSLFDWESLRTQVKQHGVRNSLLIAPMPTASTSQILGNNECIEPYTSNLYLRRTIAGEFVIINKHLIQDLLQCNLWNEEMKNKIVRHHGSVQNIPEIPMDIKLLYKTAWEIKQKSIIDQAVDRGPYVCQSQSMNLFVPRPTFKILTSMHFYAWKHGLKTGMYYLRTQPASQPVQFTLRPDEQTNKICDTCSA